MTESNVFNVIHAANHLGLNALEDLCAEYLEGRITCANVGEFAKRALEFSARKSLELCQTFFARNASEIIHSEAFLHLSPEAVSSLCSPNVACSQLELFESCSRWAQEECVRQKKQPTCQNIRKVLGHILTKIQFSHIPLDDFLRVVVPYEILPYEEVGKIIVKKVKQEQKKASEEDNRLG